jgi:predicted  nucleic acid-binding Zn-ribbon protein
METREAFINKVSEHLRELSAKIDEMKVQASLGKAEARDEYERHIDALNKRKQDAERRLTEMRGAGEEAWKDLKTGIDAAMDDLKKAAQSAAAKLRGK